MRYPMNTFAQLCERVELNEWSYRYFYPINDSPLRNEINRIGLETLLKDMGSLEGDFDKLPNWYEISGIVFEAANRVAYQMDELHHSINRYPIMDRINEIRDYNHRMYEERIQREKALQAEITQRKADRLTEKNRIQEHRNELKESFKHLLKEFNLKDFDNKLKVIIQDVKRNPNAYPLDLLNMTQEELQMINPELRQGLKERLLMLKDKKYKSIIDLL
jgi:hypothetical protein